MTKDFETMQKGKIIFKYNKYPKIYIKYVDILEMNNKYREFSTLLIKEMYDKKLLDNKVYNLQKLLFSDKVIDRLSGINISRKVLKLKL